MSLAENSAAHHAGADKGTLPALSWSLGRCVFGVASLVTGVITLVWRDYNHYHHLRYIVCAAAVAQILGGAAIQFRRMAKTGAVVLGAAYLVVCLILVPPIIATPKVFDPWGNFFEQFSLLVGAVIVYASLSSRWAPQTVHRMGRVLLGICTISFTLYQAFYLHVTASLVPKLIPPSQIFWAIATTIFFGLGAVALLTNRMTLLASRLLTAMLLAFGVIVWVPLLFSNPHSNTNWSETAETFAIAGALWILADLLGRHRLNEHRSR